MKKLFKSPKFKIKKTAIIVGVILICLAVPIVTHAGLAESIARAFFGFLANLIIQLLGQLVTFGAQFIDLVINKVGFEGTYKSIAGAGWKTSRDIANMFFILIMVLIAFGTILRIEQYGVKKLLPKLVIVALLINFSLPISYLFIDFSNLTANVFLSSLSSKNVTLGESLIQATKTNLLLLPSNCNDFNANACDEAGKRNENETLEQCRARIAQEKTACEQKAANIKSAQADQSIIEIFVAAVMACIFMGMTAFVLFAGGLMLIVRLLFLAILVILAPLAFMCYMVPSLGGHWKNWWSSLLKWCFFAPIFMFFFWLAITSVKTLETTLKTISTLNDTGAGFVTRFAANMVNSVGYFLFIGLILGGIIVAQKMGIAGASVAMSMAQKAKKGALDWGKRNFVTKPATYTSARALGFVGGLFGEESKVGGRLRAKSAQMKQSLTQTKENKAYANLLKTMNGADLLHEVETAGGSRRLLAIQEAKKRGLMRDDASSDAVAGAINTMRSYGDEEGARSLEELRPDAIKDGTKQDDALERAFKEGTHKKWSKKLFEGPGGRKIAEKMLKKLGSSEFAKTYNSYTEEVKTELNKATKGNFTNNINSQKDPDGKEQNFNLKIREAYAKATGDIAEAFSYSTGETMEKLAQEWVEGFNGEEFSKLKGSKSKELAIKYMTTGQVYNAGMHLSGEDKKKFKELSKTLNPTIYEEIETSPTWGGKPKQQSQKTTENIEMPVKPRSPEIRTVFLSTEDEKGYKQKIEEYKQQMEEYQREIEIYKLKTRK